MEDARELLQDSIKRDQEIARRYKSANVKSASRKMNKILQDAAHRCSQCIQTIDQRASDSKRHAKYTSRLRRQLGELKDLSLVTPEEHEVAAAAAKRVLAIQ